MTPLEVVEALDRHIIGQHKAKRAVAVALRNHLRRRRLPEALQAEVSPKNILMIGATGVGKTEIARRLAKLARAPFLKVEATKFTEVGYVGRDVDSIVRDLVGAAVTMVEEERKAGVAEQARRAAEVRLLEALLPGGSEEGRASMRTLLEAGKLEERVVEIEVEEATTSPMMGLPGMEQMGQQLQDAFSQFMPKRRARRKLSVSEARRVLAGEEADRLIDHDEVQREAVWRAENAGIVFLDELDKIAGGGHVQGPDVSGEGVQRDLLPIVEGTTVQTRWGPVSTDHVLFIAAGAFTVAKPSDLIPELQGRFPVRVELEDLTAGDLQRILTQPEHALTKQYQALLAVDGTHIEFTEGGVEALARAAERVNREIEDIGARRLHTILETVLEDVAFGTGLGAVRIDEVYVERKLGDLIEDEDLSRYVL
ncbi:MAG: ATP-dependent protease ATPase subunit HslU [Trueperaceae bacterium]|nr:ATP-dependent protease ATPase subunit HslU [Trueperaceae bacterium]